MHLAADELSVDACCEVIAVLKRLNVVRSVLVVLRVLVARRVMDVDVRVVVIDHHNAAAVRDVIHVLRPVILLLLRCLITLLLCLNVIQVVLIQTLLGHAHLVRPNPPVLPPSSWSLSPASSHRRNIRALLSCLGLLRLRIMMHVVQNLLVLARLIALESRILEGSSILSHYVTLHLVRWFVL